MKKETKTFGNNMWRTLASVGILLMRNFEELVYERFCIIFGMVVLGQLICMTFVWSSLDNFKNNFGDNYFISSLIISFLS
jgi:hypothetical protein